MAGAPGLTRAQLEALVERRKAEADVKGAVMAERMRRNLLRRRTEQRHRAALWAIAALAAMWAAFRLSSTLAFAHPALTDWWESEQPPADRLGMPDVVLSLEYPLFATAASAAFATRAIPRPAAQLLADLVRQLAPDGRLTAAHWHGGDGRTPDLLLGMAAAAADPALAAALACTGGGPPYGTDVGVPWADWADAWSAKVWVADGAPAPARGTMRGVPLHGPPRFWPDPDAAEGRKRWLNPWAPFFAFGTAADLAGSLAVREYLCGPSRPGSLLHVLCTEGLAGLALRAVPDAAAADEVRARLLGSVFGAGAPPRPCGGRRAMTAVDTLVLGSGAASILASFAGGLPLAAVGTVVSAGAAAATAAAVRC